MRRFKAIAGGLLLAVLAASPVLAADYTSTPVGTASVSKSKVVVTVPMRLTCPAPDPSYDFHVQTVNLNVSEAIGKQIAHGSGGAFGLPLIPCDGAPHTVNATVSADVTGPPFSKGWMSISGYTEFQEGIQTCGPGCGQIYVDVFVPFGPVDIKAG
jgi:hypothetical protein